MPAVSVLMPVYNGERHLALAIDSILAQTHRDFEFLIVDDGSTDRSREIVRAYPDRRIRLIALDRNVGLSAALNAGLHAATAPLVARQDADDLSEPHRVEKQLSVMQARPDVALLGSRAVALNEDGKAAGVVWRPVEPVSIQWYSLFDNPFAHSSMMFRTAVVRDEFGGFDPRYDPFSQDYALWCRVMERYAFANLPDRLVRYRVHPSSVIGSLDEPAASNQYRQQFAGIVRELVVAQARRIMGTSFVSDRDGELMASFILGLEATSLERFLSLFERLLEAFLQAHPAASELRDFRETLARQFDAVAFRVMPSTRRSAATVYLHALGHHPELTSHLSWSRALALTVFGKRGRRTLGRWWRRLPYP